MKPSRASTIRVEDVVGEEEDIEAEIRAFFAESAAPTDALDLSDIDRRVELFLSRVDQTSHLSIDQANLGEATAEAVEGLDRASLDEFVRRVNAQVVGELILEAF